MGEGKVLDRRRCCWTMYLQTIFNSQFERYLLLLTPASLLRGADFKRLENSTFFPAAKDRRSCDLNSSPAQELLWSQCWVKYKSNCSQIAHICIKQMYILQKCCKVLVCLLFLLLKVCHWLSIRKGFFGLEGCLPNNRMKRDEKLLYNFVSVKNDKSSSSDVPQKKIIKSLLQKIPKTKPNAFVFSLKFVSSWKKNYRNIV